MNNKEIEIVEQAKELVKEIMHEDASGHDVEHVSRVYREAMALAKHYEVNDFVVALAALLHDLDDHKISDNTRHASDFLKKHCEQVHDQVMDIIKNMSYSSYKKGKEVKTIEGKIVQDADRLDALGAIGIARCFAYSGYKKRPMYQGDKDDDSSIAHFYQKLLLLEGLMNTEEAKRIAKQRIDFMKEYLKQFYKEWDGE